MRTDLFPAPTRATLIAAVEAVLDEFLRHRSEPLASARVAEFVALGVAGEVPPADGPIVADTLTALLIGLGQMAILSPPSVPFAVEGIRRAVDGGLQGAAD